MPDGTVVTGKIPSFDRRKDDIRPTEPNGWHPSYVNLLVRNRQVIGECQLYRYVEDEETGERNRVKDGDPMPDHFPAIIDKDLFDRVQRAVADRRISGAGRKGEGFPNLITGFGLCVCGGHLYYDKKGGTAKLRCERHRRGLCPHEKGYPYEIFEQQLLSLTEASA